MTFDQAIAGLNAAALIVIMLSMGLQVTFASVLASMRSKRLVLLCVISNYIFVPLLALCLLHLFQPSPLIAIGFYILAVCPGAPVSPPLVSIAKGDVSLAIGMMVLLAGLSALLSPLLLTALLTYAQPDSPVAFDYLSIVRTLLVAQLLPLAVGLAIHHWAPTLTARVVRPIGVLANVLMLGLIVAIISGHYPMLADIKMRGWFGMSLLLVTSFVVGWLCGGRDLATRKAVAVTTAPRNAAVGLAIATGNYAGTPVVTAVVAYGLVSMIGTLLGAALVRRGATETGVD